MTETVLLRQTWQCQQEHNDHAEIASKTVPVLTAGLSAELPLVRRGAAEALGRLGPLAKEAIPALQKATNDKDATVREAAAKAIQSIQ